MHNSLEIINIFVKFIKRFRKIPKRKPHIFSNVGFVNILNNLIVIIIILIIALIISPIYFFTSYNKKVNSKIDLVRVPYANHTIQPGTTITNADISYMNVPSALLLGNYLKYSEQIVGRCSKPNSVIVGGSMYYNDLVTDCNFSLENESGV